MKRTLMWTALVVTASATSAAAALAGVGEAASLLISMVSCAPTAALLIIDQL